MQQGSTAERIELPFEAPDWVRDFDVEAHLALAPASATVKGMFFGDLQKVADACGVPKPAGRFATFNDYPLVDYMRAVVDVARQAHPGTPTAKAICLVGRRGFSTLSSSLAGRVLFAISGRDLGATLGLVSEAYKRCLSPGRATPVEVAPGRAVIELRAVWNFTNSFQVGVFQGVIEHFGHTGSVRIRTLSPCDADYLLEWQ